MLFICNTVPGRLREKIRYVTFEIRSKWRPSARARYARARPNATCEFNSVFIKNILKTHFINYKLCHTLLVTVIILWIKIGNGNFGKNCLKANSGTNIALRQLFVSVHMQHISGYILSKNQVNLTEIKVTAALWICVHVFHVQHNTLGQIRFFSVGECSSINNNQ